MILLKSSEFICFNWISWQSGWFTSQIWYYCFPFRKFIRFSGFFPRYFRIFSKSSYFWKYFFIDFYSQKWFDFPLKFSGFRIFRIFSKFLRFCQIWSYREIIKNDDCFYWNLSSFQFMSCFISTVLYLNRSLLCSRSRT